MKPKAVVLLSGGLDSTFNLFSAYQEMNVVLALTFDYGQRAASRECFAAQKLSAQLAVRHQIISLPWFRDFTQTALVDTKSELPLGQSVAIDELTRSKQTAQAVWVPNRNGIFLNIAAGFAEGLQAQYVIPGFNREEATTFPDNSEPFMQALDQSFSFSTASAVRVHCYSQHMSKTEIVAAGVKMGLPFQDLWPCYQAGSKWCGQCESCLRLQRAARENKLNLFV